MDSLPEKDTTSPAATTPPVASDPCSEIEAIELQRLTADISARLRRVCSHLPDNEFADLVLDIARVRMRYEQRAFQSRFIRLKRDE